MNKIVLKPINDNRWAGVINYKNCHTDLCPYILKNGSRYTGFNSQEDQKIMKELGEEIHTDLSITSEFWDTFFIRLNDDDLILDLNDPYDKLKFMFLKNHKSVKCSPAENKAGSKFVMINEDDEAKKANLRSKTKRDVYKEMDKMSVQDMRDALRLYGERSEDFSSEIVESRLTEYIDRNPARFKELWIDNKARKTQVLLERAVQKGIIRKSGNRFIYGAENLGTGVHASIAWLDDPDHQDVKLAILQLLK